MVEEVLLALQPRAVLQGKPSFSSKARSLLLILAQPFRQDSTSEMRMPVKGARPHQAQHLRPFHSTPGTMEASYCCS